MVLFKKDMFRFGLAKKQMETICIEELEYLNKEIQNNCGTPFNISVRKKAL